MMNPNCYHLDGPTGVKYATQRIKQVLQTEKPNYIIRADIKSFYKSIQHHKLIQDIKKHYDDPKVQAMLKNIITNPIDTPRGYKNPSHDDIIILCKTKRQLNRCRRRMMEVLHERHLKLSRKKSRIGSIEHGFHFLGIDYSPTQTENNTTAMHVNDDLFDSNKPVYYLVNGGR